MCPHRAKARDKRRIEQKGGEEGDEVRGREGRARVGGVCDEEGGMASWEGREICSIGELTTAVQVSSKLSTISESV